MREAMGSEKEENSDGSKELDVAAIDKPELVSSVQERLNNLKAITKDEEEEPAASDDDSEDSTPDDTKEDDDSQAEPEDTKSEPTPAKEKEDSDSVPIPDAYVRAAIHRGWDQKTIDELIESNPETAKKTFEACYLDVNNASNEWAALGRAARDQKLAEQKDETTEAAAKTDVDVAPLIEKLKKEYPDDPAIEATIQMLETTAKIANTKPSVPADQGRYQTATARANAAADASTDQRINNFFGADTMAPYEKFYGKLELGQSVEDLSAGQRTNRFAVLENAEMIAVGHEMRGVKLDMVEALEKAHFMVTEPIREQVIRDNLKATATKRKKSMTLRPSESKASPKDESGKPKDRKEFIRKVDEKMASITGLR